MDNKNERKPSHSERHALITNLLEAGATVEAVRLYADHLGLDEVMRRYGNGKGGGV